jgi:hypothetical protein
MITVMNTSQVSDGLQTARALLLGIVRARSSFEPHRGEDPDGQLFVRKPTSNHAGGRHFVSNPARTSRRYE